MSWRSHLSLWDLRVTAREGWPVPQYDRTSVLVEIGKQRTAEARGLTVRRDDGIPNKVPEGAPQIIKESYDSKSAAPHLSQRVRIY
jgi:hypothetical protein